MSPVLRNLFSKPYQTVSAVQGARAWGAFRSAQ